MDSLVDRVQYRVGQLIIPYLYHFLLTFFKHSSCMDYPRFRLTDSIQPGIELVTTLISKFRSFLNNERKLSRQVWAIFQGSIWQC